MKRRTIVEARAIPVPVSVAATGGITVQRELVRCGKAKCRRCRKRPTHGPYWYAYIWRPTKNGVGGRLVSRYIGKELDLRRLR